MDYLTVHTNSLIFYCPMFLCNFQNKLQDFRVNKYCSNVRTLMIFSIYYIKIKVVKTYSDFGGILDNNVTKLSSLVPRMVIFLRMADVWRIISGPDCGRELLSAIMELISSTSLDASVYSFIHGSEDDAISG